MSTPRKSRQNGQGQETNKVHLSLSDIKSIDKQERERVSEAYIESLKGYIFYRGTTAENVLTFFEKDTSRADEIRGMANLILNCACNQDGTPLFQSEEDILSNLEANTVVDLAIGIIQARQEEREKRSKSGNASRR